MATSTPPTSPDVWAFLRELVTRLGAKNPAFFNVLAWISGIATLLSGLPMFLDMIPGLVLPAWAETLENQIVVAAGATMFFMSQIGVQRPVFKEDSGASVKLVDGDRANLPFTDKRETKLPAVEMEKTVPIPFPAEKDSQ